MLLILAAVSCVSLFSTAQTTAKSEISWQIKPVAAPGALFTKLLGVPCDKLAVLAYRNGKLEPIPFQIDPVEKNGKYILAPPSENIDAWPNAGKLGELDELVFMGGDAGEKTLPPPDKYSAIHEMTLFDRISGKSRYVYLVSLKDGTPPRSSVDYIQYKLLKSGEQIVTPHYTQGFSPGGVFYEDLFIHPAAGGTGIDIMDKLKLRSEIVAVNGKVSVKRTEADFHSKVIGLRDGPVRVIRRNDTNLSLFLGVKSPSVIVDGLFYRDSFEVPSELRIPFRVDMVASEIKYVQGCDLDIAAGPFTFCSDIAPQCVKIDGRMSEEEKTIAKSTEPHKWGLITGQSGTIVYRLHLRNESSPVTITPFYEDDGNHADPPEYKPGLHMFGFHINNLLKLQGVGYRLNIEIDIVPNFNGDVGAAAAASEFPFRILVK